MNQLVSSPSVLIGQNLLRLAKTYTSLLLYHRQISKVYIKSGFANSGNTGKIVILSQLANARANITILAGFAGLAGLAKSRFFSKSRDF